MSRYILQAEAQMDIHMLLLFLEVTTCLLVTGIRPKLHGIVIPHTWLFAICQRPTRPNAKIFAYISGLRRPLIELAAFIIEGRGTYHATHYSVLIGIKGRFSLNGRPLELFAPSDRSQLVERMYVASFLYRRKILTALVVSAA